MQVFNILYPQVGKVFANKNLSIKIGGTSLYEEPVLLRYLRLLYALTKTTRFYNSMLIVINELNNNFISVSVKSNNFNSESYI